MLRGRARGCICKRLPRNGERPYYYLRHSAPPLEFSLSLSRVLLFFLPRPGLYTHTHLALSSSARSYVHYSFFCLLRGATARGNFSGGQARACGCFSCSRLVDSNFLLPPFRVRWANKGSDCWVVLVRWWGLVSPWAGLSVFWVCRFRLSRDSSSECARLLMWVCV